MISVAQLTPDLIQTYQNTCANICSETKMRFCGVINSMGKLVAGGFRNNIKPLDNEEERKMWYMQSALEMTMKKEFGNNLGDVHCIVTYRDNVTLVNILIQNHVVLLSLEKNADMKQMVDCSQKLFRNNFSEYSKLHI